MMAIINWTWKIAGYLILWHLTHKLDVLLVGFLLTFTWTFKEEKK